MKKKHLKIFLFVVCVVTLISVFSIVSFAADPLEYGSIRFEYADVDLGLGYYDFEFTYQQRWYDYIYSSNNNYGDISMKSVGNYDLMGGQVTLYGMPVYQEIRLDSGFRYEPVHGYDFIDSGMFYTTITPINSPTFDSSTWYSTLPDNSFRFNSLNNVPSYVMGSNNRNVGRSVYAYYYCPGSLYVNSSTTSLSFDGLRFTYYDNLLGNEYAVAVSFYRIVDGSIVNVRFADEGNIVDNVYYVTFNLSDRKYSSNFVDYLSGNGVWLDSDSLQYQEYYDLGYTNGYSAGYNSGYEEGTDYGLETGYNDGYYIGRDDGYDLGYDAGYGQGYDDGLIAGEDVGYQSAYNEGFDAGVAAADGDSFFSNFFTNILSGLDALTIVGGFSVLDVIKTICGLFVTIWILKLIAGG